MNNIVRTRRILNDLKQFESKQGENRVYYIPVSDDTISEVYVMIIGPEDTPYELGFYFFLATYPENYPFAPIKVKYLTTESNVRMNPNLYGNGKVCLSILGTWNGPGWTSLMNIFTVFNSIVAEIFVKEPFKNEPGQEYTSKTTNSKYNNYLNHENLRLAIIGNFMNIKKHNKYFYHISSDFFKKNKEKYSKLLDFYKKKEEENKNIPLLTTPLWTRVKIQNKYKILCDNLNLLILKE